MSSNERPFAITVFGATGFTGRLTAEYLARAVGGRVPWAIAGRSRSKLDAVRRALVAIDPACASVGVVEASVDDAASLARMTAETAALLTTVGPYMRYGLPVAEACVEQGAHYADITGEPQFVQAVIDRCDARARDKGLRVVNTCGFDSVPHDLGALYTVKLLPRNEALTVEAFVRATGTFSGGTWQSAVEAFSNLRAGLASLRVPTPTEGRRVRGVKPSIRYDADLGAWAVPLPTIDPQVVLRSAAALSEYGPDFRYAHNAEVRSTLTVAGGVVGVAAVVGLAQIAPAKRWLLSLKQSGEGPGEAVRARARFSVTFRGRGGGRTVEARVSGGDGGYTETAKMVAEAALCLSVDADKLPPRYGVLTPAVAMGDLLTERLQRAGIRFEVLRG
jgi:short subunit dehydrogenase-like uncharacterized protein